MCFHQTTIYIIELFQAPTSMNPNHPIVKFIGDKRADDFQLIHDFIMRFSVTNQSGYYFFIST